MRRETPDTQTAAPVADRLHPLYGQVRAATRELCRPLCIEDYVPQSMPDASPVKWHLAHTSWFFETFVLGPAVSDYSPFDPGFALLFNSYYHAAGERYPRPARGLLTRPGVEEILAYRQHVDDRMEELLAGERVLDPELAFVIELGLNHEEQHQELLLTDLKHLLAQNPLEPAYRERPAPRRASGVRGSEEWVPFDGGLLKVGSAEGSFAFDNERPRHRTWLAPFELARAPVRNGEYLEFMEAGGYRNPEHWLSDGWDARTLQGWEAPLYWKRAGPRWSVFTLSGARALDPDEPVCHLSYYEADAYARWRGARLPLEHEWELAAESEDLRGNFLEAERLHPSSERRPDVRLQQLFGDVWEWTASAYTPYPGFEPFQGMVGEYNGKWMSNRYVLRGGSCATPRRHIRAGYRNFFGPEARWQFSGLRLARSPR